MTKTIAFAAACGLALTATPALAGVDDVPTAGIEFRDLNLASPEGQAVLDQRIDIAARKICRMDSVTTGTRIRSRDAERCYKTALKSAKTQVAARIREDRRGG